MWGEKMLVEKWDNLPEFMKNNTVREYYEIIEKKKLNLFFKRVFDIVISIILILIFSPILITVAILIKLDSTGRVFFKQDRVTKYGKIFKMYKFRTMVESQDQGSAQVTMLGDKRITRIGKILRKFRIDELPQLFNIFIGDISFVGPRPEILKFVKEYDDEMLATLLIPAGVTSMASVAFRNEDELLKNVEDVEYTYVTTIMPNKVKLNLDYIKNISVFEDIKIMFITVITVFFKSKKN